MNTGKNQLLMPMPTNTQPLISSWGIINIRLVKHDFYRGEAITYFGNRFHCKCRKIKQGQDPMLITELQHRNQKDFNQGVLKLRRSLLPAKSRYGCFAQERTTNE